MRRMTRGQAIKAFCLECMGAEWRRRKEWPFNNQYRTEADIVTKCTVKDCALYPFRKGKETVHSLA